MQLTKNISLSEAVVSQTAVRLGIDNTPSDEVVERLRLVAGQVQKIRDYFGKPIRISSGYRCPKLNRAIGGAKNSQHQKGEAMDIQGTNELTNAEIFHYAKKHLDFDQLIWEFGTRKEPAWVHLSYKEKGNRKQVLCVGV